jgi:hypothetical protein
MGEFYIILILLLIGIPAVIGVGYFLKRWSDKHPGLPGRVATRPIPSRPKDTTRAPGPSR